MNYKAHIAELNLKKQDAANRGIYEEAAKWRDAEKAAKAELKKKRGEA